MNADGDDAATGYAVVVVADASFDTDDYGDGAYDDGEYDVDAADDDHMLMMMMLLVMMMMWVKMTLVDGGLRKWLR